MSEQYQTAIHPTEKIKPEWIKQQRSLKDEGLTVSYFIEPPDAVESPPMSHHLIVMQLSQGTRQITRFGGCEYDGEFNPGEFFLHPASRAGLHSWETTDETLVFIIDPLFLAKVAMETECINPDRIEVKDIVFGYDSQLENIAYSFLRELQTGDVGSSLYTDSLANLLAVNMLRNQCVFEAKVKEFIGGLSPYQTKQAIDFIQAHLDREIGLKKVSQLMGLSQFHFIRQFKKSVGMTPHQYVMQQRVEMAKGLLKRNDIAIADVAFDCGFSNQSHLGRVFKKYTGVTPKSYRQQVK